MRSFGIRSGDCRHLVTVNEKRLAGVERLRVLLTKGMRRLQRLMRDLLCRLS